LPGDGLNPNCERLRHLGMIARQSDVVPSPQIGPVRDCRQLDSRRFAERQGTGERAICGRSPEALAQ
jgi:hypothetical protein